MAMANRQRFISPVQGKTKRDAEQKNYKITGNNNNTIANVDYWALH